jgi:hypothetical protein
MEKNDSYEQSMLVYLTSIVIKLIAVIDRLELKLSGLMNNEDFIELLLDQL